MADESIGIQLARVEGKIDRIGDAQRRSETDITDMRARVSAIGDTVARLDGLNIQERLVGFAAKLDVHDTELDACRDDRARRAGAIGMAKFIWTAGGVIGGAGIVAILRLVGVH